MSPPDNETPTLTEDWILLRNLKTKASELAASHGRASLVCVETRKEPEMHFQSHEKSCLLFLANGQFYTVMVFVKR